MRMKKSRARSQNSRKVPVKLKWNIWLNYLVIIRGGNRSMIENWSHLIQVWLKNLMLIIFRRGRITTSNQFQASILKTTLKNLMNLVQPLIIFQRTLSLSKIHFFKIRANLIWAPTSTSLNFQCQVALNFSTQRLRQERWEWKVKIHRKIELIKTSNPLELFRKCQKTFLKCL